MNNELMFSTGTNHWSTPQDLFDKLNDVYGFTLDPCATKETALCSKYYTEEDNGLSKSWKNEIVFCNPPYSDLCSWVKKCHDEANNGAIVVALIPSRTDTIAFHDYILPYSGINSNHIKLSYWAGLFDGEGMVRIHRTIPSERNKNKSNTYSLRLSIKMTDENLINEIKSYFNFGSIYKESFDYKKDTYKWECNGSDSFKFLTLVYPYLRTKKAQAYVAIKFNSIISKKIGKKHNDNTLLILEEMFNEITELKLIESIPVISTKITFIRGRLKFSGNKNSAPFPSCIVEFKKE